jgi:hypothetical protein
VKASILVVVIDVQGPDSVTIKKGVAEGTKVSRLQLTVGDDDDAIASLTAWRETAERWGNATEDVGLKKGDVVFLAGMKSHKLLKVILMPIRYLRSVQGRGRQTYGVALFEVQYGDLLSYHPQ